LVLGEPPVFRKGALVVPPPDWWAAGVAESSYLEQGYDRRRVVAVARTLRPDLPDRFRAAGIPPFLPRSLGGAGLANPSTNLCAGNAARKALASLLYGQSSFDDLIAYERVWTDGRPATNKADALKVAADLLSHCKKVRVPPERVPDGYVPVGDPEEVRMGAISVCIANDSLMMPLDESSVRYPSLPAIAKKVRAVREKLLGLWQSAKPVRKPEAEALVQYALLRSGWTLAVPAIDPLATDSSGGPAMNDFIAESSSGAYLQTWRDLAVSSVTPRSELVVEYLYRDSAPWSPSTLPHLSDFVLQ
jgi:hypothetical protein